MRCPSLVASALVMASVAACGTAHAQQAGAINTNDYSVEFFQGPVLAPLRVTGLAGAYVAYAEGIDGLHSNPATSAVREPFSVRYFDYDLDFSVQLPATFGSTDFDNDGKVGFYYDHFVFYNVGGMLQFGRFGVGAIGDTQWYDITPKGQSLGDVPAASLNLRRIDLTGAVSFWHHQASLGVGARAISLQLKANNDKQGGSETALSLFGWAPQAGLLIQPNNLPWRLGVSVRAPVESSSGTVSNEVADNQGVSRVVGFAVPSSIHVPWEIRAGVALQLGSRPLNPPWIDPVDQRERALQAIELRRRARAQRRQRALSRIRDPKLRRIRKKAAYAQEAEIRQQEDEQVRHLDDTLLAQRRARYWSWPREHILVLVEALITGPSDNAVSLESFLSQTHTPVGRNASVTGRLGFEGEPVVGYIKTRFGTYLEPARIDGGHSRQHATFGFDLRLFSSTVWGLFPLTHVRVSALADLAPRYENLGLSIGTWH